MQAIFLVLLASVGLFFFYGGKQGSALVLPEAAEWKTGDFSIEIKDWDQPLGTEGIDNSGLKQDTCAYQVESLNQTTGS